MTDPQEALGPFERCYKGSTNGSSALLVDLDDELDVWFTVIGNEVCLDADTLGRLIDDLCDTAARPRPEKR